MPNRETRTSQKIAPVFTDINVDVNTNETCIVWNVNKHGNIMLSVPNFGVKEISVFVDGEKVCIFSPIMIRNQYSWVSLYQTELMRGKNWELRIKR